MGNIILIIILIMLVVIGFTLLIEKKYANNSLIKYIPFSITFLLGVIFLIKVIWGNDINLTFIYLATYNLIAALCSLITIAVLIIMRKIKK